MKVRDDMRKKVCVESVVVEVEEKSECEVADVGAYLYSSLSIDRIPPSILKVTEAE
jgi:hypothetical protein